MFHLFEADCSKTCDIVFRNFLKLLQPEVWPVPVGVISRISGPNSFCSPGHSYCFIEINNKGRELFKRIYCERRRSIS